MLSNVEDIICTSLLLHCRTQLASRPRLPKSVCNKIRQFAEERNLGRKSWYVHDAFDGEVGRNFNQRYSYIKKLAESARANRLEKQRRRKKEGKKDREEEPNEYEKLLVELEEDDRRLQFSSDYEEDAGNGSGAASSGMEVDQEGPTVCTQQEEEADQNMEPSESDIENMQNVTVELERMGC